MVIPAKGFFADPFPVPDPDPDPDEEPRPAFDP